MDTNLIVCEECDAVHRRAALPRNARAHCERCGAELYNNRRGSLDTLLALTLTGLILFIMANAYPLVSIELGGERSDTTLVGAVLHTSSSGMLPLAVMAGASLFLLPFLQLVIGLYVLAPLRLGHRPKYFIPAMHALRLLRPWCMVEVFLLGALVAIVKLAGMAKIEPNVGLWAFGALSLVLTALSALDLHEIWDLGTGADLTPATHTAAGIRA